MRQEEAGKLGSKSDWVKHAEVIGKCWTLQLQQCKFLKFRGYGVWRGSLHQHCTKYLQICISSTVWPTSYILLFDLINCDIFSLLWLERVPACNLANRIKFCSRPGSSACNLEAGTCGACIHSTPEACLSTPHICFSSAKQNGDWYLSQELILELQRWPTSSNEVYRK